MSELTSIMLEEAADGGGVAVLETPKILPIRPAVALIGRDANVGAILGSCREAFWTAAREQEMPRKTRDDSWSRFVMQSLADDLDHFLRVVQVEFDVH